MSAITSRLRMAEHWIREWRRWRHSPRVGDPEHGTVFILDGVGGWLFAPLCVHRKLRQMGVPWALEIHDWHSGLRGELLYDLIAYRHNRNKANVWASVVAERRRQYPDAPLHIIAFSGGTGFAAFGLEQLPDDVKVDTVILACSALSPRYPLTGMLRHVRRCVVLVSRRDFLLIGLGTSLFGTMDRRWGPSAGLKGFRRPVPYDTQDKHEYEKLHQLPWNPSMRRLGHYGHHVGWATLAFTQEYLASILNNQCNDPMHIGPLDDQ